MTFKFFSLYYCSQYYGGTYKKEKEDPNLIHAKEARILLFPSTHQAFNFQIHTHKIQKQTFSHHKNLIVGKEAAYLGFNNISYLLTLTLTLT